MSTLLPFLYQTRTILRANPRTAFTLSRSIHATRSQLKRDEIPFAAEVGEPGEEEYAPNTESGAEPGAEPKTAPFRRGTITPSERYVFERIFADIRARGLKPNTPAGPNPVVSSTERSAMLIMQQAAQDAGQARPAYIAAPGLLAGAARDRNKALLRFPLELRAAARKALGTIEADAVRSPAPAPRPEEIDDSISYDDATLAAQEDESDQGWKTPAHTIGRSVELETLRHAERTRVESLMASAKTDFALWDVLEKEVFTMPARLGFSSTAEDLPQEVEEVEEDDDDVTEAAAEAFEEDAEDAEEVEEVEAEEAEVDEANAKEAGEGDVEEAEAEAEAETEETDAKEADGAANKSEPELPKLSLYVHGPLYPAYLLIALRRLDTSFSASSPLVFTVLPRIKEIGLESYVLGVSTPFYNELMEIYWNRRGDLVGMLNLLEEMRHCGLYFDTQTASVLNRVEAKVLALANNQATGSFGRAVMTMPEYERGLRERIRHWHRVVDLSVKEKERDMGY
ncbi:uncharacterized protein GGS25DRAFT_509077 [Hypoxylon fragiforme]|uniref:uncharacterized protein n=1 Tax=Hypoxylon fragiforme TaxID=63214 RepID=UPI0020C6ECAD|nr:uncharacterized protein GGS25DRAFT_509077 [Hypoxylon fragiforme]KAI2602888.1 hypothetical protein GGS25DRAFT_509077 [Hypoxylon fragiforme]